MATETNTDRIFNFSAGPAVLPLPVLQQAQRELTSLPGIGSSVLEISHRSKAFAEILESSKAGLRELLSIPDDYQIVFLQGGARLQFSMVPMNLLHGQTGAAEFVISGSWGKKARDEALREGSVKILWDGKSVNYDRLPDLHDITASVDAAYVHITSNETIEGVQFKDDPDLGRSPLVCDASSDFLHRPVDIRKYGLIYACAQKNAGPAGLTVVIIRDDLLERSSSDLPGYMNYRAHVEANSLYNTPPTFAIYVLNLVVQWIQQEIGGLELMHQLNREKAQLLYDVIDSSKDFYRGHAQPDDRSLMNVTFRLSEAETEARFLAAAERRGLCSLKGHRSVGGIRASIYNAMPLQGVEALRDFMQEFQIQN